MTERAIPRDRRKVHVPPPDAGSTDRSPRDPALAPVARPAARAAPRQRAHVVPPAPAPPRPAPRRQQPSSPAPPAGSPPSRPRAKRRRRILRGALIALPVLLLAVGVGGWLYARSVFDKIERVPVGHLLADGGEGTNYLLVGSDSRDVEDIVEAGLDPNAFAEGGGQRSDTMLVLRFVDGEAKMLSLPRDLYLPISGTGGSSKLNAAYAGGGPERLVSTIQDALGIPIHRYVEVDFVSFAYLVDSLGGITIDLEHPTFDRKSGFRVDTPGPVHLDGPNALAYVRAREVVEVIDGQERPDPTADLGRIQRQQTFLRAVFAELGESRNPLTLARAANASSGGLRIDDQMSLLDAMRFAWRLRSLDPVSSELPVLNDRNEAGAVLLLVEPDADAVLDEFR